MTGIAPFTTAIWTLFCMGVKVSDCGCRTWSGGVSPTDYFVPLSSPYFRLVRWPSCLPFTQPLAKTLFRKNTNCTLNSPYLLSLKRAVWSHPPSRRARHTHRRAAELSQGLTSNNNRLPRLCSAICLSCTATDRVANSNMDHGGVMSDVPNDETSSLTNSCHRPIISLPPYVKVKVKFTPEQSTKAQRGSRCIALLFP